MRALCASLAVSLRGGVSPLLALLASDYICLAQTRSLPGPAAPVLRRRLVACAARNLLPALQFQIMSIVRAHFLHRSWVVTFHAFHPGFWRPD
jgi:hypothetical protein